jgi:hypothetical protein
LFDRTPQFGILLIAPGQIKRRLRRLVGKARLRGREFLLVRRLLIGIVEQPDDVVVTRCRAVITGAVALVPLGQKPVERISIIRRRRRWR